MGCDPSRDLKEKLFRLKKGPQGIYFLECERNNKDGLSSFQTQAVKINKFWASSNMMVWSLQRDAFHESMSNEFTSYHYSYIENKMSLESWCEDDNSISIRVFLVQSLVTSMKELLDSCVIPQVECH